MQNLLSLCEETYKILKQKTFEGSIAELLKKNLSLKEQTKLLEEQLHNCWEIYHPNVLIPKENRPFKAISWNLERGKNFDSIAESLKNNGELKNADFYFFTEVDWGMARSQNRNIAADLGKELGYYAYFSPSYFNFSKGHGAERHLPGENKYGLHGKAILSRYPLKNLRAVKMSNTINKLSGKEARLGEKRALMADLNLNGKIFTLTCTHLDVFSSPTLRAKQLEKAIYASTKTDYALISGDWNTNTLNCLSGDKIFFTILKQIFLTGPKKMIRHHYSYPERKFDKPTFEMLKKFGYDYENANQLGVGTFDLLSNDEEIGLMGKDRFPEWMVKWIGRQIEKAGGSLSFKLDWFATKNLNCLEKKVIKLKKGIDYTNQRPSDHHPVLLTFNIPTRVNADHSIQNNVQSREESSVESDLSTHPD